MVWIIIVTWPHGGTWQSAPYSDKSSANAQADILREDFSKIALAHKPVVQVVPQA